MFGAFDKLDVAGMIEEHRKTAAATPPGEAP